MPKHAYETDPLILRRQWERDVARALADADRLTLALADYGADTPEATLLRTRIKALRIELQILRGLHGDDKGKTPPYRRKCDCSGG